MEDSVLNLWGWMLTVGGQCHGLIAAQTSWGWPRTGAQWELPVADGEQRFLTQRPDNRASKVDTNLVLKSGVTVSYRGLVFKGFKRKTPL